MYYAVRMHLFLQVEFMHVELVFSNQMQHYVHVFDSVNVHIFDMCNMSTSVILQVNLYAKSVHLTYENMNSCACVHD